MSLVEVSPWWHVEITTTDENDPERDFYVQAPNSRAAALIALTAVDWSQTDGHLHTIHVGIPLKAPRHDTGFGWHDLPKSEQN